MSGSRSLGGNRGDNNRNVRGRFNQASAPPAVPPAALPLVPPIAPVPQPPPVVPVVAPPEPPAAGGVVAPPPPQPPAGGGDGGGVVAPPQLPAAGGGGADPPPPLVQVRGYSVIPGFPPYPLDGVQTNVYPLFTKKLSYTDVNSILHVTGKNLPNFLEDLRDLLGVGENAEGDVRLRLVRGNEVVADGDIKLKRHVGTLVSLRWRMFALGHHVPLAEMKNKVAYAWCEWVKVVGVEKHDLRIIIKLPD